MSAASCYGFLLHTHSFALTEAERAIRTLAGELPSELALGITVTA